MAHPGQVPAEAEALARDKHAKACAVLGTPSDASEGRDPEVLVADKGQARVEGGLRFLKAPRFFVSALFVKKPTRMEGVLLVMPLAVLGYSVAQRRRRKPWATPHETVPNHIKQPTLSPTFRGIFQLLEGLHRVQVTVQGQVHDLIEGRNEVQIKLLRLFGNAVCQLYHISTG